MIDDVKIDINYSGMVNSEDIARKAELEAEAHNKQIMSEMKELLEISIRTKTLINLVSEQYRGSGKSTLLLEKAEGLGATLVVPFNGYGHFFQIIDGVRSYKGLRNVISFRTVEDTRGIKIHSNGFLVDEGVPPETVKELSVKNEFLGGFGRL